MVNIKTLTLSLSLLLIGSTLSFAQNQSGGAGSIEGVVTEALTGDVLIGVNVMIEGTSLGAPTDIDGQYLIRRVPAGTHVLLVSYIGYEQMRDTVTVADGETLQYDVVLQQKTVEGAEVTVSSQAEGQRQAINEQINSRTIKNVVSAEKIRELPDESAATALSRLPGVSLQDGDKIVVRGIQAKMNAVTVNGIQLPSTDVNDRSTNLGFISSNMLSGIEVTKAVTPDMDANSIGGTVNLRLQEAPEDFHFDVMAQGGYNTQDETSDNYQVWASASDRFFDNKLGVFGQINARRVNGGGDYSQAGYNLSFASGAPVPPVGQAQMAMNTFVYGDQVRITEQQGGSLIMDYKLPNGKLVLQNTYAATTNDATEFRDVLNLQVTRRDIEIRRNIHDKQLLVNSLQGENDFDIFKIDYGFSHAYSELVTDLRYGENYAFGFRYLGSEPIPPYQGSFSDPRDRVLLTPEDIYGLELNEEHVMQSSFIQNGGARDESFEERALTGNLNVTIPVTFSDNISGSFKVGGNIRQTQRSNDIERIYDRITENPGEANALAADWMREQGMDPTSALQFSEFKDYDYGDGRGSNFLDGDYRMNQVLDVDLMDTYIRLASPAWNRHRGGSRSADYEGTETLTAGYGMADFKFGEYIEVLGGVRYENLNMDYEADLIFQTHEEDGTSSIPNESESEVTRFIADSLSNSNVTRDHFFPNIQLRVKPADWVDVRLAYTKTISRPDYNAIVPTIYRENQNVGRAGNPNLRPSVSDNFDANVSFYSNKIGLFTVGGFYKKIEDVFFSANRLHSTLPEYVIYPTVDEFSRMGYTSGAVVSASEITTYLNNPNPAHLKGFELDWQTHFWYLPKPLNNMVLNVNYTRVFSEMDYQQIRISQERVPDPDRPGRVITEYFETDTIRTARLIHQGDHVVNVALGADYKGFSGRVSFRMQGNVITSVGNRPENDAFTGNIYGWDFNIRQRLPVEGLSVFLNGINIFHNPTKDYQSFVREAGTEPQRNLRRTSYYPRRFQLGIRYSL